jgi:hypothetical protein
MRQEKNAAWVGKKAGSSPILPDVIQESISKRQ